MQKDLFGNRKLRYIDACEYLDSSQDEEGNHDNNQTDDCVG